MSLLADGLSIGRVNGIDFYESNILVVQDGDKKVKKTFLERFTWKFWERYRLVPNMVPDKRIYMFENKAFGHPETIRIAIEEAEKRIANVQPGME